MSNTKRRKAKNIVQLTVIIATMFLGMFYTSCIVSYTAGWHSIYAVVAAALVSVVLELLFFYWVQKE